MKQFLTSLFSDIDSQISSKRVVLLWIALPTWAFVHYFVFKGQSENLQSTLMEYDFFLIVGLSGIVLSEKFTSRKVKDTEVPEAQ